MRVLVAGARGLIGTAAATALRAAGHEVISVSRSATAAGLDNPIDLDLGASSEIGDLDGAVDVIVNLVGVAAEDGENTFERAHVTATQHLLDIAVREDIPRFIHISVVDVPGVSGGYFETKRRGEALVRQSDRRWTVLRPGLVYGPGDDMVSSLFSFVRAAPVFAIPGGPTGALQVVDVDDVARAIVASVERAGPEIEGATFDIVGPAAWSLRELVAAVADATGLPTIVLPLPTALMRMATRVMSILPSPPLTASQLEMLIAGLTGDPSPASRHLDLTPRPLSADRIRAIAAEVTPTTPSVRIAPDAEHATLLRDASKSRALPWLALVATALLIGSGLLTNDVWMRMLALNLGLGALTIAFAGLPWRELARVSPRIIGWGLGAAGLMLGGAFAVVGGLRVLQPQWVEGASAVYTWGELYSPLLTLALLAIIVTGEDLVWRIGIGLPLCGRLGPMGGALSCGALFALAHITTGPPILLFAAFVAGTAWCMLAVRTRSLFATALCHFTWDAVIVFVAP